MARTGVVAASAVVLLAGGLAIWSSGLLAQGSGALETVPVDLTLRESFDTLPADARTEAVVVAAEAFLATLTDEQRAAAV